jgi:putative membrane protein insertion efficiency factor
MKEIFNQIICSPLILLIKLYKYLISPLLGHNCRFLPTCSDYFLESLEKKGFFIGLYSGMKRILKCHPIKFLGGNSGYDPVEKIDGK